MLDIIQPIILLFIVLDPVSTSPYFYILTRGIDDRERNRIIVESVFIASLILLFFVFGGDTFMMLMSITIDDFRIAGGMILLVYSILGLLEVLKLPKIDRRTIAVVPMATPLLAGPGAITMAIYVKYLWGLPIGILSVAVNSLIALPILLAGKQMLKILGENGAAVLDKIMSMLMAAYGVSIIREGIINIVKLF